MNVQTTAQLPLILHANKVILKSFNPGFNNTWTKNFKMYKLVLEKAEELEIKLPLLLRSQKKLENSRKTKISFCFIGYSKDFDCVDNNKADNSTRDGNTRPPYLPPEKPHMQVRKQGLEMDMKQWTGSKLGKKYIKAVYFHPAYLN